MQKGKSMASVFCCLRPYKKRQSTIEFDFDVKKTVQSNGDAYSVKTVDYHVGSSTPTELPSTPVERTSELRNASEIQLPASVSMDYTCSDRSTQTIELNEK